MNEGSDRMKVRKVTITLLPKEGHDETDDSEAILDLLGKYFDIRAIETFDVEMFQAAGEKLQYTLNPKDGSPAKVITIIVDE